MIPLALFPEWIIEQYILKRHALNGKVHLKLRCAVWGLHLAGILANKQLGQKLALLAYHECLNMPGLWYHDTDLISFTLVVNNFSIKYINNNNAKHLRTSLKMAYKLTKDWTGDLYCGIALNWDYINRTVEISMPGHIKKKIQKYGHLVPDRTQKCLYWPKPKKFGSDAQAPLPLNDTPKLDAKGIQSIQQIVGSILYYAQAVDMMVLIALSSNAVKQTKATEKTLGRCAYNCLITLPPMKWQR